MNKRLQTFAVISLLVCSVAAGAEKRAKKEKEILPGLPACVTDAKCELYFSPNGGCTDRIIKEITAAKKKVLVLAYSFTSDPISKALVEAKSRGVEVSVIIDSARVGERSGDAYNIHEAGVEVYSDGAHSIQHQKVVIIDPGEDSPTVIMGSFNFTGAAEHGNSENILVVKSREVSTAFDKNWSLHRRHSKLCSWEDPAPPGMAADKIAALISAGLIALFLIYRYRKFLCRRK